MNSPQLIAMGPYLVDTAKTIDTARLSTLVIFRMQFINYNTKVSSYTRHT